MRLPRDDAELFFKLMWGLQFHVNRQLRLLPDVTSAEEYASLPMSDKTPVRDALWDNPDVIDAYVKKNPDGLSIMELDIVRTWKRFISDTFYIFRFLKKHTIFIGKESRVYGVLGLHDAIENVLYGRPLPIMVETVFLPFKDQIVCDGVLQSYNIIFGRGIRSGLKDDYMAAKQNDRIITTLEPETAAARGARRERKPSKDWGPTVEEVVKASEHMRGGPAIHSAAFSLLRASAKVTQAAVHHPDNLEALWELGRPRRKEP